MNILDLDLAEAAWLDPETLRARVTQCPHLRLRWQQPDLYSASSKTELAQNWLKTWYVAETLARCASDAECSFREADLGVGLIILDLTVSDPETFVQVFDELAPVFDPDESEQAALIYDEAEEWLDKRVNEAARFVDLERCYRDDAEDAKESEHYRSAANEDEQSDE